MFDTYESIMKGFTKVQKKLDKLINANTVRIDDIWEQIHVLESDKSDLLAENAKAEQALMKLKEFTGEC
jgi:hypothetical protein